MKTKKKKAKDPSSSSSSSSLDLHTAATRIAVAQICNSVGYTAAQTSALETLTNVAVGFLRSLATAAASSATSTGRTQCNLYDVIRAFEDLYSNLGFIGNSDLNRRLRMLSDSSILRDTMKFVCFTREVPFAKPLPRRRYSFPANSPCFDGESGGLSHVPKWLPEFPRIAGDGGEMVVPVASGDEGGSEKRLLTTELDRKVSKLPEKRKKVSFRICGGKSVINVKCGGELRSVIYDDDNDDDEKFVNGGCNSNYDYKVIKQYVRRKKKKLFQE